MLSKLPQCDPIGACQRKVTAARRVGEDAQCACGEARPEALVPLSNPVICAECQRKLRGKTTLDQHHVAGRANSPVTIPVLANDHRADLSVAQYDWPRKTLENPDGSPLLAGAACNRGFTDTAAYLAEKLLLRNAHMLECLDAYLAKKLGPKWWRDTELEQFAPKHKSDDRP